MVTLIDTEGVLEWQDFPTVRAAVIVAHHHPVWRRRPWIVVDHQTGKTEAWNHERDGRNGRKGNWNE